MQHKEYNKRRMFISIVNLTNMKRLNNEQTQVRQFKPQLLSKEYFKLLKTEK